MIETNLVTSLPQPAMIVVTLALTAVLVAISVVDARQFRIPDILSLPLIGLGLTLVFVLPDVAAAHHLIGAGGGFLLIAGIGEIYFRKRGVEGLGLGDAKLFAAAGAWLGWTNLPLVLLIAASGGLLQLFLLNKLERYAAIAFGPWLSIGFWIVWMVGVVDNF